eukprot:gene20961-1148_t
MSGDHQAQEEPECMHPIASNLNSEFDNVSTNPILQWANQPESDGGLAGAMSVPIPDEDDISDSSYDVRNERRIMAERARARWEQNQQRGGGGAVGAQEAPKSSEQDDDSQNPYYVEVMQRPQLEVEQLRDQMRVWNLTQLQHQAVYAEVYPGWERDDDFVRLSPLMRIALMLLRSPWSKPTVVVSGMLALDTNKFSKPDLVCVAQRYGICVDGCRLKSQVALRLSNKGVNPVQATDALENRQPARAVQDQGPYRSQVPQDDGQRDLVVNLTNLVDKLVARVDAMEQKRGADLKVELKKEESKPLRLPVDELREYDGASYLPYMRAHGLPALDMRLRQYFRVPFSDAVNKTARSSLRAGMYTLLRGLLEIAADFDENDADVWTPLIQQQIVCLREHRAEEEGVDVVKLNHRLFATTHSDDVWGVAKAKVVESAPAGGKAKKGDKPKLKCFNCGGEHFARNCSKPKNEGRGPK